MAGNLRHIGNIGSGRQPRGLKSGRLRTARFNAGLLMLLAVLLWPTGLRAQELNCRIQLNTDQIGGTDKAVYESFKNSLTEFLNTRQWMGAKLGRYEKIDCSFNFIFQKTEGSEHTVEMQVQSRRPVFNSTYTTTLLNARQGLEFTYQEGETLEFNPNVIDNNLTATITFWVYLILGMDFDSFAPYGGEVFFQAAQDIVNQAQGTLGDNWKAHDDEKNCWGWMDALMSESQKPMRLLNYQYHRLGLDVMADKVDEGRAVITKGFEVLDEIKRVDTKSPLLSNFADAKLDEWVQIYSKAGDTEKQKVYDRLVYIYPGQSQRLEAIKETTY